MTSTNAIYWMLKQIRACFKHSNDRMAKKLFFSSYLVFFSVLFDYNNHIEYYLISKISSLKRSSTIIFYVKNVYVYAYNKNIRGSENGSACMKCAKNIRCPILWVSKCHRSTVRMVPTDLLEFNDEQSNDV